MKKRNILLLIIGLILLTMIAVLMFTSIGKEFPLEPTENDSLETENELGSPKFYKENLEEIIEDFPDEESSEFQIDLFG